MVKDYKSPMGTIIENSGFVSNSTEREKVYHNATTAVDSKDNEYSPFLYKPNS